MGQFLLKYHSTTHQYNLAPYIFHPLPTQIIFKKKHFKTLNECIQTKINMIFGGDVNAINPIWDALNRINSRGIVIADHITRSHFHILNNGQPTRQILVSNINSTIDITCSSPDITKNLTWKVLSTNLGSDHFQ